MRIPWHKAAPMYLWAVALIALLAAVSSYVLKAFPYALLFAVLLSSAIEVLIRKYYLRHPFRFPWSGLITGLIIGAVAPINSPILLIAAASIIAVSSKFLIKYRGANIFNPAALGLLVSLTIFSMGDEWWASGSYNVLGIAITLAPLLVILAYEAKRLPAALSFIIIGIVSAAALQGIPSLSAGGLSAILLGVNYFFAFVMLVEPKTSPNGTYAQIAYGSGLSLLYIALSFMRVGHSLLAVLLIGNIIYLFYRRLGRR